MSIAPDKPVTDAEVDFLQDQGWNSGFGWETELDWWWEPSYGLPMWITDHPDKMKLWLADREAYEYKRLNERAAEHAMELLAALEAMMEGNTYHESGGVWGLKSPSPEACELARAAIAKTYGPDAPPHK